MPLDGLRAWIGEVERKLGKRTRVFLVLALIAIGGAGAAVYLAIDAQDNAVSESDVQALQRELEARIGGGTSGGGAELAQVEAEVEALKAEVEALQGGGSGRGGGGSSGSGSGNGSGSGGSGSGASHQPGDSGSGGGSSGSGASTGAAPDTTGKGGSARLGELLEETREEAEKAESKHP